MLLFVILLLLALLAFGVGFTVHVLWWLAVILVVAAVVSYFVGRGRGSRL